MEMWKNRILKVAWRGIALLWLVGGTGAWAQLEGQTVKGFHLPEYNPDGTPRQQLYGETATFLPEDIIQLTGLKMELFHEGEVSARVTSPECAYAPGRKRAASKEHIRIVTEKGVLTGDGFAWNGENEQFQIFRNVKVTLDAQTDAFIIAPESVEPLADIETGTMPAPLFLE
ncbi:MAG: hypothetical protein LBN38_00810 [Verrucomicrobiota bacterium]|jgi:hypothetical protein|nr:hypothetical protein [Verrucomicrobiota bacterium]